MRSLDNPNIPKLYEVYESDSIFSNINIDSVELLMTYYEGGHLYEKLENFSLK